MKKYVCAAIDIKTNEIIYLQKLDEMALQLNKNLGCPEGKRFVWVKLSDKVCSENMKSYI